ncbi:uncharacterized protein CC84DRAFT_1174383 [Paraphaeosphaeria sporulosa]|uniref:Uncharacterized protein n=1 Tax=Paraphaeosphaeria sporulosa TaxID=1460663 RepID=A0A177CQE5_9PLEO|nr:uncharacterized protein CC84DRAFT_1174383 [Paraphaeosphaeria sporulosa]OAG08999.1 hypothetical protein CC84DRAFT_1174383 [Paraphaeosphaeria sporulosa]
MPSHHLPSIGIPMIYTLGIDASMTPKAPAAFTTRIDRDDTLAGLVKMVHFRYAFTSLMKYQRGIGLQGRASRTLVLNEKLAAIHDRATERELESLVKLFLSTITMEKLSTEDVSGRIIDMHRTSLLYWVHLVHMVGTPFQPEDQPFHHLKFLNIYLGPIPAGWIRLDNFVPGLALPCIKQLYLQDFIET